MRTLYLTALANEADRLNASFDTFLKAEIALKTCIHRAVAADEWPLESAQCEVIEAVLRAYDAQLASLRVHKIEAAKVRLGRMLEQDRTRAESKTGEGFILPARADPLRTVSARPRVRGPPRGAHLGEAIRACCE